MLVLALPLCPSAPLPLLGPTLALSFPWTDWQFWIVTAVFLAAVAWLFRGFLPVIGKRIKRRRTQKRVTLTVGGKPADGCDRCGQ